MIECYVISLFNEQGRRRHIQEQFRSVNIKFNFFDAITPSTSADALTDLGIKQDQIGILESGELACLLSHVKLWDMAVKDQKDYMAIFEDDVHLGEDFEKLINNEEWLSGLDIVKLEDFKDKVELSVRPLKIDGVDRKLHKLIGKNLGCAGYILSLQAAQYLLDYIRNLDDIEVIDAIVFNERKYPKSIASYQLVPAIVIQDAKLKDNVGFKSSLTSFREDKIERLKKPKNNNILFKIKRESSRFVRSLRMRRVGFR